MYLQTTVEFTFYWENFFYAWKSYKRQKQKNLDKWFRNKHLCEKYRCRNYCTLLSVIFDIVENLLNWHKVFDKTSTCVYDKYDCDPFI